MFGRATLPGILLVVAALTACDLKRRPTEPGTDPVASVVVRPDSVALDPQQTQTFQALGVTAAGDTVAATVSWSATGGTITPGGLFTADASNNDGTVTATLSGAQVTGSGKIKKRRLVQIFVTPANANLQAGNTQQFTAYGRRNTGDSVSVNVSYSATGGTITPSGLYTAGSTAGTFRVIAQEPSASLVDTSAIAVSVAPVASVSVSPAAPSVAVGQTVQLTATPRDASGNALSGRVVTWASSAPAVATVSGSGLVTGVAAGSATITATSEGRNGTAAVTVTATVTNPGTVSNLAVSSVTDNSVTLSFTEVTDGAGQPAKYEVRWAAGTISWGSATPVAQGTCSVPLVGTAIGATKTCTVQGLAAGTGHQFQLIPFRGTLNVDAVFGPVSNVASGTTSASTAPVATVTVTPATANLGIGQTLQLVATLKDAAGNTLTGRTVTWSSALPLLASVNSNGLVSGLLAGIVPITATSEGKNGSSSITVAALPPPTNLYPNEPSGLSVIKEDNWESGLLGAWFRKFTSADKPITIVPITDSPLGEGQALQIGFNQGHQGGGGTELEYDIPSLLQPREMFVGYYVQVSSNWQGHSSGINKMVYLDDGGSSFSAMWYEMFGSGSSQLGLYVVNQSGSGPAGMHENVQAVNFTRGVWHKVEIYQKQGSPGIIRVWVDGILAIDRSDVFTRDAAIGMVTISGIWGGIGDTKAHFDYMRFDHIRISGR